MKSAKPKSLFSGFGISFSHSIPPSFLAIKPSKLDAM